ncbi:MAG: hypothetical protein KGJ43_06520, partial [Acidobacteriota bacterium]|nr:hypothetical protein [Acidobacteriota bacterium]
VSAVTLGAELAAGPTPEEKVLFKLGEVSASLSCSGGAAAPEAVLSASGPSGAHADSGLTATNLEGRPPEGYPDLVNDVVLGPAPATVVKLATNAKAPAENVASLSATITTPAQVVQVNAYIDVKPSSFPNCLVHGSAYSVPATS